MVGPWKRLGTAYLGIYHGDRLGQGMGARVVKIQQVDRASDLVDLVRGHRNAKLFRVI